MKHLIVICCLLTGCSAPQQEVTDFQPSRPVSHPAAPPSGEQPQFVIKAFPVFTFHHEYGGTVVGHGGQLMDGSKIHMILELKAEDRTIRIEGPPVFASEVESEKGLKMGKQYRFTLVELGKGHKIIAIHDGDRQVYPRKKEHPTSP